MPFKEYISCVQCMNPVLLITEEKTDKIKCPYCDNIIYINNKEDWNRQENTDLGVTFVYPHSD